MKAMRLAPALALLCLTLLMSGMSARDSDSGTRLTTTLEGTRLFIISRLSDDSRPKGIISYERDENGFFRSAEEACASESSLENAACVLRRGERDLLVPSFLPEAYTLTDVKTDHLDTELVYSGMGTRLRIIQARHVEFEAPPEYTTKITALGQPAYLVHGVRVRARVADPTSRRPSWREDLATTVYVERDKEILIIQETRGLGQLSDDATLLRIVESLELYPKQN
jgi:hypothetical protein